MADGPGRGRVAAMPVTRDTGADVLRLDVVERLGAEVEALLARLPEGPWAQDAPEWLASADALLQQAVGDHDRARVLEARAALRATAGIVREDAHRAATLYERAGDVVPAAANYAAAAMASARTDDVGEALDAAVRALVAFGSLPDGERDPLAEARMTELLGVLCHQFFDYDRALQFFELSARALRGERDPRRWSSAVHHIAEVLLLQARRLGEAPEQDPLRAQLLLRAEQLCERLMADGEPGAVRTVDAPRLLAALRCERGRPDDAWPLLEAATAAAGTPPRIGRVSALRATRGLCLHRLGRSAEALPELDAAVTAFAVEGDVAGGIAALRLRSLAREAVGDLAGAVADARRLADEVWARHQRQAGGFMDQVWSRAGVEGERRDLEARAKDLVRFAEQDPLTGLANRRAMEKFCAGLPPREPVCLVLVDVDHFKDVNDRFGHAVGDAVLREVGALLARSVRSVDRVARWGGEEFLVALPGGSAQLGADAADRMRSRVERAAWSLYAPGLRLTVSAGVASGEPDDLDAVLGRADAAMYEAKRAGRNRVVSR